MICLHPSVQLSCHAWNGHNKYASLLCRISIPPCRQTRISSADRIFTQPTSCRIVDSSHAVIVDALFSMISRACLMRKNCLAAGTVSLNVFRFFSDPPFPRPKRGSDPYRNHRRNLQRPSPVRSEFLLYGHGCRLKPQGWVLGLPAGLLSQSSYLYHERYPRQSRTIHSERA